MSIISLNCLQCVQFVYNELLVAYSQDSAKDETRWVTVNLSDIYIFTSANLVTEVTPFNMTMHYVEELLHSA